MKPLLTIAMYLYLFSPIIPFVGRIGSIKLLYILLPVLFSPSAIKHYKQLRPLYISFLLFYIYVIFRTFIGADTMYLYNSTVVVVEDLLLAYVITILHLKYEVKVIDSFLICLIIASVSAVLGMFSPAINSFIENYLSAPQLVNEDVYLDYRGFGIGLEKTFSYSIIIAILYTYLLFYANSAKITYALYLLSPIVALSILINARTGMVIFIIGLLFHLIFNARIKISKLILSVLMLVFFFWEVKRMQLLNYQTEQFVYGFFYEMSDAFWGTNYANVNNSTLEVLIDEYRVLPKTFVEWLIGKGLILNEHGLINHVDSGFANEIVYGGLIYLTIVFMMIIIPITKITNKRIRPFLLFLLISCVIVNFKGSFVPMALGFKTVSIVLVSFLINPPSISIRINKLNKAKNEE